MYLKGIEIKGFKSFLDKTMISFPKGMISIVGPNGSGKSNILDAIRWVLGEQSIKSLRGDKLEDVIFSGTQTRNALGYCEVTLIIDNEDKKVDIDYTELSIKRKAYRSGESQFYINGKKCRLKDIKEILLDTGIGKEGYSIISQGRIDEIINSNGNQKRALLEEASGITKYRYKKEEGEKNLNTALENLERINDIYIEIENQIKPLQIQKEKAEKYLKYKEQLQTQEINKILQTENELNHDLSQITDKKFKIDEIIKNNENEIEKENILISKMQDEYDYIARKKSEIYKENSDTSDTLTQNKTQISIKSEAIKNLEQTNQLLSEQLIESTNELDIIVKKYDNLLKEKEYIYSQKSEIEDKLNVYMDKQHSIKEDIGQISIVLRSNEQKLRDVENEIAKLETRMEFLKTNIDSFNKKFEEYEKSNNDYEIKKNQLIEQIELTENKIKDINLAISNIRQIISKNNENLQNFQTKSNDIIMQINNSNLSLKDISAKTQVLENFENDMQGFSKGIKNLLKNSQLEGIQNAVANVITVKKGYEKAIEQLLSGRLENIIIDKSVQTKKAIDYLKKENLGRATFLPLDTIKSSYMNYNDEGIKAIDVVEYDKKYENIISTLLGKMVIVDNMDIGLKISAKYSNSFRIATKTGEIFNVGGSITGGSSNFSKEIFTRRSTIAQNKEQMAQIKENINKLQIELDKINCEIEKINKDNFENQDNIDKNSELLYNVQSQKTSLIANLEHQNNLQTQLEEEKKSVEYSYSQSLKSYENDKGSLDTLNEKLKDINAVLSENNTVLEKKNTKLTDIQISLNEFELKKGLVIQNLENIELQIKDINETINSSNKKSENSQNKITYNNAQIEKYQGLIINLSKANESLNKQMQELMEKLSQISKGEEEINEKLKLSRQKKEDLISKCNNDLTEKLKIENEESKINYKIQLLEESLNQSYCLSLEEAKKYKDDSITISQSTIKKLRESINALGNINLDSIEEFNKTNERYLFYKAQKEDLEESISKINSIIRQLEKSMIEDFKSNFDMINKNFNDIFKILFGGGSGKLILEDETDILNSNIEISVQPPGKKLRGISMLSGGEKALSAIALLFAIIARKPVPFCILDEIDAPLDDANIYRYIQYLITLVDTTQFITITHRRGTMEASDYIYGVTMQEKGISDIVSLKLEDAKHYIEE